MPDTSVLVTPTIQQCLHLLTPRDLHDLPKRRLGQNADGGCVLADDLAAVSVVYSFGVGGEVSFEHDLAQAGKPIYLFDHTVPGPPHPHANFHFRPEGLGPCGDPAAQLYSLQHQIHRNGHDDLRDMLLKIDIEGAEYEVVGSLDAESLTRFRQIALEIHWLSRLNEPAFRQAFYIALSKINEYFVLFHVHGNNCAPLNIVDGFAVADVLELSYMRRDLANAVKSKTIYPTRHDFPNDVSRQDHLLWFYPFLPLPESIDQDHGFIASLTNAHKTTPSDPSISVNDSFSRAEHSEFSSTTPGPQTFEGEIKKTARRLNILYFACHEVLEYDDLRLLTGLGHRVFSIGQFSDPDNPPSLRPQHPEFYHDYDWKMFTETGGSVERRSVGRAFAALFDIVIVGHNPQRIIENLPAFGDRPIIYRSIGQSNAFTESLLATVADRVHIVRYSKNDVGLPGFSRSDQVIYFGKYLNEFPTWSPENRVISFHNSYPTRAGVSVPTLDQYNALAECELLDLYGFLNDGIAAARGIAPPVVQSKLFQTAALYFYVYSVPPSYTLSLVEAMATGTPVLAPSALMITRTLGNVATQCGFTPERYEVADLLDQDPRLLYDTIEDAATKLQSLLNDLDYRQEVSHRLREKSREMFDAANIRDQWENLLQSLVGP